MSTPADLPGAPESRLPAGLRTPPPGGTPAPPWPTRVQAVVWCQRAGPAALATLPAALRRRARLPLVVGAFVRYLDSPVGPYDEVIGAVLLRPLHAHVPFLAVDSLASLAGGREHWALPKTLARFERGQDGTVARGDGWRIEAGAHPRGPRLPAAGLLRTTQVDAGGRERTARAALRGSARAAGVLVQVGTDLAGSPGSLAGWLRAGQHPGAVVHGSLRVGPAS